MAQGPRTIEIEQSVSLPGAEFEAMIVIADKDINELVLIESLGALVRRVPKADHKLYIEGNVDAEELLALYMLLQED